MEEECFFEGLNVKEGHFPQSPCPKHEPHMHYDVHLKQALAPLVPVPSDLRSRKSFLVKAHDYATYGGDTSIATAILVSCMTAYKGWEGYYFNYLTVDKDVNLEQLAVDHNEGYDNIDPDDICELYAHVLIISMTRRFLDNEDANRLFNTILEEKRPHSQLLLYLGSNLNIPVNWMRIIKDQMQTLPRLKSAITHFLLSSIEKRCKIIIHELHGAEMATFKAAIYFMYHAPKTFAHIQKYIVREMLLLRKHVIKIKSLPKDERELAPLLHPSDSYIPPVHVYSNLAFCTVFQYKRGEIYGNIIDCPHKDHLKVHVRTKLKGPFNFSSYTQNELNMLQEIDINEDFQEQSGPLLVDYETPKLEEMLREVVAEISIPVKDPVEAINNITF